ncbi:Death-associated inhibitor of apoptosis 2 [Orchesella cincta]|uniref:Death-associated inhibitor of apoptosis 2 n=1 Tax=Orchesella cincta TaxID=48709 RepID=A0A1D2N8W5_ORCCI|nr:Death-associated inhibitor of apoptosis 2 [Orchesella cincta]
MMDNATVSEHTVSSTTQPSPGEVDQVSSTTSIENDNSTETNSNNSNANSNTPHSRCIEPVGRMIVPRGMESANPFSRPRDFDALKSERARLDSFSQPPGWPIPFIRPEDCAQAGFFFLQDGDKVQCAFCRGVAGEWEQGDNPRQEHRRHFPRCPFICGLPVGNISVDQGNDGSLSSTQNEAAGIDVCGPYTPDISQLALSTDQPASVRGAQPLGGNGNEVVTSLGIKTCGNGPAHPSLVTVHSRIKTFSSWPVECGQTPEIMAEAGFFYIGRRDHVKCFYCDGGLRNWEANDDPWLEHARWFSNCTYVILNKGDSYVKDVNKTKPPVVSQQYLNKHGNLTNGNPPRRVSDQELRELIDTPIVQAALEMGMELGKVKGALQRKIQQTGQPFITTEALLEAVLGRDSEYESDSDSDTDEHDEDEDLSPAPRQRACPRPNNTSTSMTMTSFNGVGSGSSAEASSSSSAEHSCGSGDEESLPTSTTAAVRQPKPKTVANRCASGDSGVGSVVTESNSSGEDEQGEVAAEACNSNVKENDLEEEVRKLREATLCKICMDNQVGIVFLPCGHLVSCTRCATALSNCALCRQPIKAVVRTYLS